MPSNKETILIVEDEFIVANDLSNMVSQAQYEVIGIADSVVEARQMIDLKRPDWVLLDIVLKGRENGIELAKQLVEKSIPFLFISANSNQSILEEAKTTNPYGFLVKPFKEKDLIVMLDIARYRLDLDKQSDLYHQMVLKKTIEQIAVETIDINTKLIKSGSIFQSLIPFDVISLNLVKSNRPPLFEAYLQRTGFDEYQLIVPSDLRSVAPLPSKSENIPLHSSLYNGSSFVAHLQSKGHFMDFALKFKLNSMLEFVIPNGGNQSFILRFYSCKEQTYTYSHVKYLKRINDTLGQWAKSITEKTDQNSLKTSNFTPIDTGKPKNFNGIIGNNHGLLQVLHNIGMVAPSETSVLILGESGTGKEGIARSIHQLSARKNKPMVTVNCAAMPEALIQSELFGHEKGSFTGASEKRIGKFELADGGTIFLDEIGELPMESQVKLLRVLQEKEIERIGGGTSIKVDVRIIAATNRNLEKEVAENRFRLDLYYRLNVFPVTLPPLRNRKDDIPELVDHFISYYCEKAKKEVMKVPDPVMKKLLAYEWPGNIRQLQHIIERSVILSISPEISEVDLPPHHVSETQAKSKPFQVMTMEEMERDYITNVLRLCNGKVGGPGGAAELLGMPATTLSSRMTKLNIKKEF